jgi:hypothetical protein
MKTITVHGCSLHRERVHIPNALCGTSLNGIGDDATAVTTLMENGDGSKEKYAGDGLTICKERLHHWYPDR